MRISDILVEYSLSPEQRAERQARLADMRRNGEHELAKYFQLYMNDPGLRTTDSVERKAANHVDRRDSQRPQRTPATKTTQPKVSGQAVADKIKGFKKDAAGRTLRHGRYYGKGAAATAAAGAVAGKAFDFGADQAGKAIDKLTNLRKKDK